MDKPGYAPSKTALTANAIKVIAATAMLIDHIGYIFVPWDHPLYIAMRMIGRITGPIFFFFLAEGYHRTSHVNRYTLRLLVFALISYFPFILVFNGGLPIGRQWFDFNVIYTLFMGLLALRVQHEIKTPLLRYCLLTLLLLASIPGDWGVIGFVIILIFDTYRENFSKAAFCYSLFIVTRFGLLQAMLSPFEALWGIGSGTLWNRNHTIYIGMFFPLILLYFYQGEKGRGGKIAQWGFYVFYPLHLTLLAVIRFMG